MGSAGFFFAGSLVLAMVGAGVWFYWRQQAGNNEAARLFAPRARRLACIERASLDGGRKLLLVRRDDVEHLILVGGPIDLVVESGIRAEALAVSTLNEGRPVSPAPLWSLDEADSDSEPKREAAFFPRIKDEDRASLRASRPDVKAAE